MNDIRFYLCGNTAAAQYAAAYLTRQGVPVSPVPEINVTHLLLPVPSFEASGRIRGGESLSRILSSLPQNITVLGGMLAHDALKGKRTVDFLQDEDYLAENAAITAECAMELLRSNLPVALRECPILILGWGRIGKCLGRLLKAAGASVSIYARKAADRSMIRALGYLATSPETLAADITDTRVIINTAPAMLLPKEATANCPDSCFLLDLASRPGIADDRVLWARGLPGRYAPESSGQLIGKTALKFALAQEVKL